VEHNQRPGRARIFVDGKSAGVLEFHGDRWSFTYFDNYQENDRPVSLRMPVQQKTFSEPKLFSYFEGLFVEGWQKDLARREFGETAILETLINRCSHSVGDVQIGPWENEFPPAENFEKLTPAKRVTASPPTTCLLCLHPISPVTGYDCHPACSDNFYGQEIPPAFPFTRETLPEISLKSLSSGISLPGVQQKVSMAYGFQGAHFIIKPQVPQVNDVPELENLWMSVAKTLGLIVAEHGLCRLGDGSLAYITKRFDRQRHTRIHVEDFSQILNQTTYENSKFEGTYDQIARAIDEYMTFRTMEQRERLFQWILFNFIFGNNDAHLKNIALIRLNPKGQTRFYNVLAPFYDLVPTAFLDNHPKQSEMALPLLEGGQTRNLHQGDFEQFAAAIRVESSRIAAFLDRLFSSQRSIAALTAASFVRPGVLTELSHKINKRLRALGEKRKFSLID